MKVHEHRQCIGNNPECQVCTGYSCESYPHCIICGEDWQDQVGPPARAVQPCRRVGSTTLTAITGTGRPCTAAA